MSRRTTGRTGRAIPAQRDGNGSGGRQDSADPAPSPLPVEPFNRRVELLVAVVDSPEESELSTQLLEGRGWSVRPWVPGDEEEDALGSGRRGLLVEVRLHGARFGAVQAAVSEIEWLARRHQAGMWVVDAALVEHELSVDHRTVLHAYRGRREALAGPSVRQDFRSRIFAWRELLGLVTSVRIIKQDGRPRVEAVAELLARGAFTRRPYDPGILHLRIPAGMEGRNPEDAPAESFNLWPAALLLSAYTIAGVACGYVAALSEALLVLLPILIACALVWPVGTKLAPRREPGAQIVPLVRGSLFVGISVVIGMQVPGIVASTPSAETVAWAAVTVVLIPPVSYGLRYAFVHSWFSRNANWAVPALIPALGLTLPWFGGLMHTVYLRRAFDLPSEAASVSVYWSYAASLVPVGAAALGVTVVLALAGWARHFHLIRVRGMERVGLALMTLFVVGMTLLTGIAVAQIDSSRARAAVASGRDPARYYGIQGSLVCVKPLSEDIAVFNGPLASARPLLTFGPSGDRVWLWDPRRGEPLSVRLEDVAVTEKTSRACS
ncbi:hypothetical protein ADK34_17925 [Streptomyces viridochromogenes]|uniref:Uncharacterized protein n=1 Tax=Streptomyces viridochromogenes TaxID=1938 RepID=A0A0L8KGV4_STRVR|nr:hypothetical protein ADK34_17925 [Streptomyces viridochromogenes]